MSPKKRYKSNLDMETGEIAVIDAIKQYKLIVFLVLVSFFTFFSLVTYVAVSAQTVGAKDRYIVNVSIDGNRTTLPTRAKNVADLLERMEVSVSQEDIIEPGLEAPINEDNFSVNVYRARPVRVIDGSTKVTTVTAEPTPELIAKKAGIDIHPEDELSKQAKAIEPEEVMREGIITEEVVINRAKLIKVNLYGEEFEVRTHVNTVQELLNESEIQLEVDDSLSPGLDSEISDGDTIYITRNGLKVDIVEEEIEPPVEVVNDPNAEVGTVKVRQEGTPGVRLVTYEIVLENGEEVSREVIQEVIKSQPVTRIEVRGTKPMFSNFNTDGIPARVFCSSPAQRNWKNISMTNAALGRAMAAERGWTGAQWEALLELFACESSWIETAGNPYSGAYGIPQSLPASKMATHGSDYMVNPRTQIAWGLDYIANRYGTPIAAMNFHHAKNWY